MVRIVWLGLLVCVAIVIGCRRDEPVAGPVSVPVVESPQAPIELSDAQKVAIEAIAATGGVVELEDTGFPLRIDLASERVFADEDLVRAVLEFPRLKGLRLTVSSVSSEALSELATLTELEELLLQDATLTDEGLTVLLGAMPGLKRLTLRRVNHVSDTAIEAVAACDRLEVLALIEMSQVTGAGLERLRGMKKLRSLDLRNCGGLAAADIGQLTSLEGLVELKLGGPTINDGIVDSIVRLPGVRSLAIEDAEISAAFFNRLAESRPVAERLRSLAFARCYGVTDEALETLGSFTSLETLSLRDAPVTGAFLANLSESGEGPLPWKTLVATNAFLDDAAVQRLPKLAPMLVRLDLRGNLGVTDESQAALDELADLKELELEGTGVTATAPLNADP
jgi:hypothetical protein